MNNFRILLLADTGGVTQPAEEIPTTIAYSIYQYPHSVCVRLAVALSHIDSDYKSHLQANILPTYAPRSRVYERQELRKTTRALEFNPLAVTAVGNTVPTSLM